MGAVQGFAALIFDADRPVRRVEQDAGGERMQLDLQPVGPASRHVEHAFARANALMVPGGQRGITQTDGRVGYDAPVVGVEFAVQSRPSIVVGQCELRALEHRPSRFDDRRAEIVVEDGGAGHRFLGMKPALPSMPAGILSEMALQLLVRPVRALLDALEIGPHVFCAPRRIAGQVRDLIPVGIVRVHQNHRAVGGASAEDAGARVEDAVDVPAVDRRAVARVPRLFHLIAVVADEEIPPHGVILGGQRMEGRHVVVVGQAVHARRLRCRSDHGPRIAARLEQQDTVAGLGQSRRHRPAARAGADDDVVGVVFGRRGSHRRRAGCCVVGSRGQTALLPAPVGASMVLHPRDYILFRNPIRSVFSAFVSPGSSGIRFVPK